MVHHPTAIIRNWQTVVLALVLIVVGLRTFTWAAEDSATETRVREILKTGKKVATNTELLDLGKELLLIVDSAVKQDDYVSAGRTANQAMDLFAKWQHRHLLSQAKLRRDEVQLIAKEFKALAKSFKKLETNPDDADANRKVGLFRAAFKGEWSFAAELLKKSGDPLLVKLVDAELNPPSDAASRIKLAEDWAKAAELETGALRTRMHLRAHHWYMTVQPQAEGDQRKQIDKALSELSIRYLTDMEEQDVGGGAWSFGKYGAIKGGYPDSIVVNTISYPLGLGMHPAGGPFPVKYRLNGKYKTLQVGYGLNDTSKSFRSELRFSVLGDGRLLWKSPAVKTHADSEFAIINVKNVQTLELRTECIGHHHEGHAVWLDPFIAK